MESFLDLFGADDPARVSAARYQLHFLGNAAWNADSWVLGLLTRLVFVLYEAMVIPANAMLGVVLSSGLWLEPLAQAYQKFTTPLYAEFPPWTIACVGLALVGMWMLTQRPASTKGDLLTSEAMDRIGTALAMTVMVVALTSNPFALIMQVLELANGFCAGLASRVTHSSADTVTIGQTLVDQTVRTPAIVLNFGRDFSPECKDAWSQAMAAGQELSHRSGCYVDGQNKAGPLTFLNSLVMLFLPGLPMLAFSVIAAWKYLVHLSTSVVVTVASAWVAAVKVKDRRGFDTLSKVAASAAAHLVMAVITSMVAIALPATCSGLAAEVLGLVSNAGAGVFAQLLSLGVGFSISTWVIWRITSNTGVLVRLLHADANMTLEHTLGVKPREKLKAAGYSVLTFRPFSGGSRGDAPKAAVLAEDPVRSTAASDSIATDSTTRGAPVNPALSAETAEALEQLVTPAQAVADRTTAVPSASPVRVTSTAGAAPGSVTESAALSPPPVSAGDVHGYYFTDARKTVFVHSSRVMSPAAARGVEAADFLPALPAGSPPGPRAIEAAPSPEPSEPPDHSTGSQLMEMPRRGFGEAAETLLRPVAGNVYADPDLDAVARSTGVTFTVQGSAPAPTPMRSPLRGFDDAAQQPAPVPGFPTVQRGPTLHITDEGIEILGPADGGGPGTGPAAVNDQQAWNRRTWPQPVDTAGGSQDVTTDVEPAPGPDCNIRQHPGSFCAPMPDFLAAEDLQAQIDEMRLVYAAAGVPLKFELEENDQRLAIRFSSDPDQRVVRVCDDQFGDPL